MSDRPHHDMGTCWCGELHATEHVRGRLLDEIADWLEDALSRNAIVHELDRERAATFIVEARES